MRHISKDTSKNASQETVKQNLHELPSLRLATVLDESFLEELYISSRHAEFASTGWNEVQIKSFLRMQLGMQTKAYKAQFPAAAFSIIELTGVAIGRLTVNQSEREIRLVEIVLLEEFRNQGIGTFFLKRLQAESTTANKLLTLSVLKTNEKAVRLYNKCGFVITEADGAHFAMIWKNS